MSMGRKLAIAAALAAVVVSGGVARATPFGGDDAGFLPSGGTKLAPGKCQVSASKLAAKLVACIFKCHDSRASQKLSSASEEICEHGPSAKGTTACREKYNSGISKLIVKCPLPGCVNTAGVGDTAEAVLDANTALVYCASPSGAFLN
jgi:hypothetical protein